MKLRNSKFNIIFYLLSFILLSVSCGPSTDERRQQEIEDSIQLEADRRELLERANRMFASPDTTDLAEDDINP